MEDPKEEEEWAARRPGGGKGPYKKSLDRLAPRLNLNLRVQSLLLKNQQSYLMVVKKEID